VSGASPRRVLALVLACAFVASCSETAQPKLTGASRDVENGPRLARDAAAILLQYSAYDYGLAGALAGANTRTVAPSRYADVARDATKSIGSFTSNVLASTLDRSGPIRDKLIPLADGFADLAKDSDAYADGGDLAVFARVVSGVTASWQRLRDLSGVLPKDDALQATMARGMSFVVAAKGASRSIVTAGPYATAADAQFSFRTMGSPVNGTVTQTAPFVVRIGPYADRASAQVAADSLKKVKVTTVITDEQSYSFTRSGPLPDAELWREPSRVQPVRSGSRRLALSGDGTWLVTGSDDGYAALFSPDGTLTALPQGYAGLSVLAFSDDTQFFVAGGQVVNYLFVPGGQQVGVGMRFPSAATQIIFVPTSRVFVVASKGPTGDPDGGAGAVGGRAPDGALLGDPFPIWTPAAGAQIAASDAGDVYVASTSGGAYDVEVFRPGRDDELRAVARIPGAGRALAVDPAGKYAAAVTDQGTYRFAVADAKSVTRLGAPVREVAFAPDGTLYLMDKASLVAIDGEGARKWSAPLLDGRRLVAAKRAVVLDGTDRLVAFAPATGAADELGAGGTIGDLVKSADGRVIGVIVDAGRAVLFTLP
jgi:hypothetical protein